MGLIPYANATGRLVRNSNVKEASPEIAAVAVIKSRGMPVPVRKRMWRAQQDIAKNALSIIGIYCTGRISLAVANARAASLGYDRGLQKTS